jgi:hypothetical protein
VAEVELGRRLNKTEGKPEKVGGGDDSAKSDRVNFFGEGNKRKINGRV